MGAPKPKCPICGRTVPATQEPPPPRPFCSARCRLADLGSWLNGNYRISRPVAEEDLDEGLPGGGRTGLLAPEPGREEN